MALKSFAEMMKIDVTPFCDERDARDEHGKTIKVKYLNWAVCKKLLHDNGAENVDFIPIMNNINNSFLFGTERVYGEGDKTNQCYFIGVKIIIDDKEYIQWAPLMNGTNPVKDNSMSQQRIGNAHARAFVKGVAMHTGLGFALWLDEEKAAPKEAVDDSEWHDILKIKKRMEERITEKLKQGWSLEEIAKETGVGTEAEDVKDIVRYCVKIYNFEGQLKGLKKND